MTLVVLCLAAVAIVAYAVSGGVGLALRCLRGSIDRLAPAAQARLYLAAALLPCLAALAVITAALAPSFGWIADHCQIFGVPHTHPHICIEHHAAVWPAVSLTALACMMSCRVGFAVARGCYALALGHITRRAFDRASIPGDQPGVRVLPVDSAQAFVLGLWRPALYITRGLVSGAERAHLQAVMAHERAHLQRRDPLRRFLSGLGLSFHIPGLARWLDRCLVRAQEMAADDVAAQAVGSRKRMARALVALAKAGCPVPRSAFAVAASDVEARVLQLLDARQRRDWPQASTLALGAAVTFVTVAASADAVHHGVEFLLGALGS